MTLAVPLDEALAQPLTEEANRLGTSPAECVLRLLNQQLSSCDRPGTVASLIQSWLDEEDAEEQKETGPYLIRTLDEDRLSSRKLYPPELEGLSW